MAFIALSETDREASGHVDFDPYTQLQALAAGDRFGPQAALNADQRTGVAPRIANHLLECSNL